MKKQLQGFIQLLLLLALSFSTNAQKKTADVYVDKNGMMRWGNTGQEVHGFGTNYTVPFAYAYRTAKQQGIDIEKAIDNDVYHFARLGFDAYRVHVWDTEISDSAGNLLDNEHLRLFDYLVNKLKQRGMKMLITPIAYWGNGWPEPDTYSPGFSHKYGKDACLTNPDAIKAQQNYLYQFLNHVNPYTKLAYKTDPDVVAFEISNEPHHTEAADKVTSFIKGMIGSMRKTGCKKPVFYNISHKVHLADAYFKAGIDGGTFQWYPTGLGFKQELQGNLLPNVDEYKIPFADNPGFKKIAKVVYEFDAADVGRSYIYPAMARSFRTAGLQWATQFAYEPTFTAFANTEYDTHFMNLAYAPQKALSLMIASKVFHKMPLYKSYGKFPADTLFEGCKVSYANDQAELLDDTAFIYTNNSQTIPSSIKNLKLIAGTGNSALVKYDGTGAYFLNKLEEGIWRLEIMPDAVWIDDPFGRNSLKKQVAAVNWRERNITLNIPSLGQAFGIKAINDGNHLTTQTTNGNFAIQPGVYLLAVNGKTNSYTGNEQLGNIVLKEYAAPAGNLGKTVVLHLPVAEATEGNDLLINATVASAKAPEAVELHVWGAGRPLVIPMQLANGYEYSATIPANSLRQGFIRYYIAVKENGIFTTYPAGKETYPKDWDFYVQQAYKTAIVSSALPLNIFSAATDAEWVAKEWRQGADVVPADESGKAAMIVKLKELAVSDVENIGAKAVADYSMRYCFVNKLTGRKADLEKLTTIVVKGQSLTSKPMPLQIAFITAEGAAYGATIQLGADNASYSLKIADIKPVPLVTLPRPYPSFLPYYLDRATAGNFNIQNIESLQISVGPGINETQLKEPIAFSIETVHLQ